MPSTQGERERLIALYSDTVRLYAKTVESLANTHGEEFDRATEEVDRLHLLAQELRLKIHKLK